MSVLVQLDLAAVAVNIDTLHTALFIHVICVYLESNFAKSQGGWFAMEG